jgi:hypothetical protein
MIDDLASPSGPPASEPTPCASGPDRVPVAFWVVGALLVAYVGLCTGNRDNLWGLDAWEHHRALKALIEKPWQPGNPTYATDEPSARYSPYLVSWALVGRTTGLDAYRTLSLAAACNTALTLLGVAALLKGFGQGRVAAAALPIMLGFYGGVPGHSNSYALADLPVQQVNPSAIGFATTLFVMALFKRFERKGWRDYSIPLMIALSAISLLDHVISAALGQLGLWIFALSGERGERQRLIAGVLLVEAGASALCLSWPWYSFLKAATIKLPDGFVNIYIIYEILGRWCVPALIAGVACLTLRNAAAARTLLLVGYASYMVGLITCVAPASLPGAGAVSRMPLPGLIFFHLALGIFAYQVGLFRLATWPGRLATLVRAHGPEAAMPALEVAFAATLAYFLLPQFYSVLSAPQLARPYVTQLSGRENKQNPIKPQFDHLLEPIGARDVVISDVETMWVIPSSKGRVVSSLHGELFTPAQDVRRKDIETFFDPATLDAARIEILDRYDVRWIVLNDQKIDRPIFEALQDEAAVVRRNRGLVLLDADRWAHARRATRSLITR